MTLSQETCGSVFDLHMHKDQLSIHSIQYQGTSCLELSVSRYEKFR